MYSLRTFGAFLLLGSLPLAAQSGPPPIPAVQSVSPMGIVKQNPYVQGRDGTYSALINGKSFWAFDDTALTKDNASGTNFIDNSLSWATNLDASQGITLNGDYLDSTGVPTRFIPFLPWESAYNAAHNSNNCTASPCGANLALWSGPLVPDPAHNRTLIFFGEIWRAPNYPGWVTIGEGFAIWQNGKITRPVVHPGAQYSTLLWTGTQVGFDSGWVVDGDTLYLYGNQGAFLAENTQIAKVALENVTDPSAYTYYAGNNTWSPNASDAVTVFNGGAAGSSVFYDQFLGAYVAIYSGVLNNNLYYNVSYTPWGPWSAPTQFFTGIDGYQGNPDYAALAHPEFSPDNGQTEYITYVHDTGFLAQDLQLVQLVFAPPAQ